MEDIAEVQEKKSIDVIKSPALAILLMSIPSKWFGTDIVKGGVIINMILGELIIILLIKICYNLFESIGSIVYAGLIAASNNNLIYYSTQLLRENSYMFFVCVAIELLSRKKKESIFSTFLLSIFTICAFLCRVEGLEIIIFYTVFKIINFVSDKHKNKKKVKILIAHFIFYLMCVATMFFFLSLLYDNIQENLFVRVERGIG